MQSVVIKERGILGMSEWFAPQRFTPESFVEQTVDQLAPRGWEIGLYCIFYLIFYDNYCCYWRVNDWQSQVSWEAPGREVNTLRTSSGVRSWETSKKVSISIRTFSWHFMTPILQETVLKMKVLHPQSFPFFPVKPSSPLCPGIQSPPLHTDSSPSLM